MADVASKQQTTALFLSTIATSTRRHTELTKKWRPWWETCALPESTQFSFSCSFFLHRRAAQFNLGCMGPFINLPVESYYFLYTQNYYCTWLYTQQMHKITSYMFRHSMDAIIREFPQRLQ